MVRVIKIKNTESGKLLASVSNSLTLSLLFFTFISLRLCASFRVYN